MPKGHERDQINETQAKMHHRRLQPDIDKQKRCFNPLAKAPNQEELGEFDIEVGTVKETGGRVGIRFMDRPRHLIACGATGAGKTNLLMVVIHGIDRIKKDLDTA